MKKILILSGIHWNDTYQRHQKIATYLSENYEVIFVEHIISSKISLKKILYKIFEYFIKKNKCSNINKKKDIRVISPKLLPANKFFLSYNKRQMDKILRKIGVDYFCVINYLPLEITEYMIDKISYSNLIYDCVRNFEEWEGTPQNVVEVERRIVNKATNILVDSFYLQDKILEKYGRKAIQILPTITKESYNFFLKNKYDKKNIKKIIYFGTVDEHIDIQLLNKMTEKYDIYILGKINTTKLDKRINYLGYIEKEIEMLKILVKFDAVIIPYLGNVNGVIPAKLFQALATKMPVYISSFYDSERLKKYVYVYKNYKELFTEIKTFSLEEHTKKYKDIDKILRENIEENIYGKIKELVEVE